ncbi:acyltransferase [Leifsonia sp. NPDC077715]|uniref:acyltransferase family protein n=1 Tax=Leifsonia sp. NPDC077715 TaxID=3155539 RepID=UPI0034315224
MDGLRGTAAVVVLLHHAALAVPGLAATYYPGRPPSIAASWLAYSPLHLAWAGTEAVYLFFVLSGFVLTRLVLSRGFSWEAYYPSRMVRLYLPVIGAVVFAAVTFVLVHRTGDAGSPWVAARAVDYSVGRALTDMALVGGTSGAITPLWSLTWEVIFSLLLPVYIFVARAVPAWVQLVVAFACIEIGAVYAIGPLTFLPIFAVGVLLASRWDTVRAVGESIGRLRWSWLVWLITFLVSAGLALSYWWTAPFSTAYYTWLRGPIVLGAAGLLVLSLLSPWAGTVLSSKPFRWLGSISFSLYLTHEPIVIAFAYLFPGREVLGSLIAIVVSILVGWLFFLVVERPSHRFSRWVGKRARLLLSPSAEVAREPSP